MMFGCGKFKQSVCCPRPNKTFSDKILGLLGYTVCYFAEANFIKLGLIFILWGPFPSRYLGQHLEYIKGLHYLCDTGTSLASALPNFIKLKLSNKILRLKARAETYLKGGLT